MLIKKIVNGVLPVFHNLKNFHPAKGIFQFIRDVIAFKKLGGKFSIKDLYPQLYDRYDECGNIPKHYFLQDLWAATKIYANQVWMHYDLGSRLDGFIAHILPFQKVTMIDIRPLHCLIENLYFVEADFLKTPFKDNSINSISALHSVEHIGLGRYGDKVEPNSWRDVIQEMKRITAVGGNIYFSVPIGRERVCFNAHRVFNPFTILAEFGSDFELVEFSAINDEDIFMGNADMKQFENAEYSCGLYHFRRKK